MPQRLSVPCTGWKSVSSTPNGVMAITAVGRTSRVFRAMQWLVDAICVALLRFPRSNLRCNGDLPGKSRSEEPTSELQSLMRISYAVFCFKKNNKCLSYLQYH